MPLLEDRQSGFSLSPIQPQERESPSWGETFEAAFALENDVMAAVDLMNRPAFKADPVFSANIGQAMQAFDRDNGTTFFDNYRDNFVGVQSEEEMLWLMERITAESQHRDTLGRSGFGGFVAATAAGIISPTSFIPLVGPAMKGKRAWDFAKEAALIGAGVGVMQETVLQAAQEDRPYSESALGVASMTVLSGLLGGAIGAMTQQELRSVARSFDQSHLAVTPMTPGSVGAADALAESPGQLARGGVTISRALDSNFISRNPVAFTIRQPTRGANNAPVPHLQSSVARGAMTQLSDGGLRMQGNDLGIPTAPGGTIENRIQTWYGGYTDIARHLDEGFLSYRFDGNAPTFKPQWQASMGDMTGRTNGKLTKAEYKAEITRALRNNDAHEIPQIAATAKFVRERLLNPLLQEAQATGVIPNEIDLKGDPSWILRDYNRQMITRNTTQFVDKLADHFKARVEDEFAQELSRLRTRAARTEELVEDLQRPADEIARLRDEFQAKLKELEEGAEAEHFTTLEDSVSQLRAAARELRADTTLAGREQRRQMLADARDMEKAAGESFAQLKASRADVRRRLRNLNRSALVLGERQAKKLEAIERIDELNMNALRRAARAGQRTLREMDKWSDAKLDAEVVKLRDQFARLGDQFDRGEERITALANDPDIGKIVRADEAQQTRAGRMTEVTERLADAEDLGRPALRSLLNDMLDETLERINHVNSKRVARQQRLIAQAEGLDPAQVARRVEDVKARQGARELDFVDSWRARGADDIDMDAGRGTFDRWAREVATEAKDKIMGTYVRLPTIDQIRGPRGSELARTLDIPSEAIEEFLENDVERLLRSTLRTLPPDIEIARRPEFGDVNGEQMFLRLGDERNQRLREIADSDLAPKTKEARTKEVNETFDLYAKNLEAVIGRLRHTWGIPTDPESMGNRLGRMMLNLNTLRLMGGVLISSVPDVARPIMRYGLTRTFRDGFLPFITNFKEMKMTVNEVRALAGGLDATMSSRSSAIFDILDDMGRGSKLERGLEYATQKMGLTALFEYWTQGMKQFSGAVAHAKFMDSIDAIVNGTRGIDKGEATRYLAENGIDAGLTERIWEQMAKNGGATKVNGRWWPNTEAWDDAGAKRAYSAAIIREVNSSIITPGVDKPLWMDSSMPGRMMGQFKSFAFASTTRTLIAGMQQRDAAVVNGVMYSLAMGAVGYFAWAMAAGGHAESEMRNAGIDKWADEAIARSGLLGVFAEVQRIAERIPATQPMATFSGTRSARRGGDNLVEALLGPSFDAFATGADVISNLHDPTDTDVHSLRTLVPYQNVSYLRRLFDVMEEAVPVRSAR